MKKINLFFVLNILSLVFFVNNINYFNYSKKVNEEKIIKENNSEKISIIDTYYGNSSFVLNNESGTNLLFNWGNNLEGQIGDGSLEDKNKPTPIDINGNGIFGDEIILDVSIGYGFSSTILDNEDGTNSLYMWGNNSSGKLGDGTNENRNKPILIDVDGNGIKGDEKIIDVELGGSHSSVILDNEDGTNSLYMWGNNRNGQLGDGTNEDRNKPIEIDIDGDGNPRNEKILQVSLGSDHSSVLILNDDGMTNSLYMWGKNISGQLGDGTNEDRNKPMKIDIDGNDEIGDEKIIDISMGGYNSSAILLNDDGITNTFYIWGNDSSGQLGVGTTNENRNKPMKIDIDGDEIVGNEKIIAVDLGTSNSSTILENDEGINQLYLWGNNTHGQIGDGATTNSDKPFLLEDIDGDGIPGNEEIKNFSASTHSLAIINNSEGTNLLYSWGRNNYGQLGDGTNENRNKPTLIDIGITLSFNILEVTQDRVKFEFDTNISISDEDKNNLIFIDTTGTKHNSNYESSSDIFTINNLNPGRQYFFEYLELNSISYSIKNYFNVLTDYEIIGIRDWNSTANFAEVYLDINSTNFGAFSEEQRTINIEYNYTNLGTKIVKNTSENIIVDKNGVINFNDLDSNSTYEITKISYNMNSSSNFKYELNEISGDNSITTTLEKLYLDTNTFEIEEVKSTTFKFTIDVYDKGNRFDNYSFVYLFFKNKKGGESPILAYKVNKYQSGHGVYEFEVRNLSSGLEYEFVGISIDRDMYFNDNNQSEEFSNSQIVKTLGNTEKNHDYIYQIIVLAILLTVIFLFFVNRSSKAYKKAVRNKMDSWN